MLLCIGSTKKQHILRDRKQECACPGGGVGVGVGMGEGGGKEPACQGRKCKRCRFFLSQEDPLE